MVGSSARLKAFHVSSAAVVAAVAASHSTYLRGSIIALRRALAALEAAALAVSEFEALSHPQGTASPTPAVEAVAESGATPAVSTRFPPAPAAAASSSSAGS